MSRFGRVIRHAKFCAVHDAVYGPELGHLIPRMDRITQGAKSLGHPLVLESAVGSL
jgi:hypothetical protein